MRLFTFGSKLSMLNQRIDAQALCCWLEFEIITTGREEACRSEGRTDSVQVIAVLMINIFAACY